MDFFTRLLSSLCFKAAVGSLFFCSIAVGSEECKFGGMGSRRLPLVDLHSLSQEVYKIMVEIHGDAEVAEGKSTINLPRVVIQSDASSALLTRSEDAVRGASVLISAPVAEKVIWRFFSERSDFSPSHACFNPSRFIQAYRDLWILLISFGAGWGATPHPISSGCGAPAVLTGATPSRPTATCHPEPSRLLRRANLQLNPILISRVADGPRETAFKRALFWQFKVSERLFKLPLNWALVQFLSYDLIWNRYFGDADRGVFQRAVASLKLSGR